MQHDETVVGGVDADSDFHKAAVLDLPGCTGGYGLSAGWKSSQSSPPRPLRGHEGCLTVRDVAIYTDRLTGNVAIQITPPRKTA
jgi:hypothetical protein